MTEYAVNPSPALEPFTVKVTSNTPGWSGLKIKLADVSDVKFVK
jgi:hypothetical protein